MVLKNAENTTKMHSKIMADKHMPHMTGLASFIYNSQIRLLYFRVICKKKNNSDFPSTIFLFFDL